MPVTATIEDMNAYQKDLEKGNIDPSHLPPCPRCATSSKYFKPHAFRERIFLILIKMMITAVASVLLRFKCPACRKTFTYYPSFAIPYKRFTVPTITLCSKTYVENDKATYVTAAMIDNMAPGYGNGGILAPSTVHRWISTLADLIKTTQRSLDLILQEQPATNICRDFAHLTVCERKYRSQARKEILFKCRRFFQAEEIFTILFEKSIFTRLARSCAFA